MAGLPMFDNAALPKSHLLHNKSIAIVGGGPAGLTLARLLQLQGVYARVFERDASPEARNQGGSLDLHEKSGQLALQRCGLKDGFHAVARPEGQTGLIYDKHGKLHASFTPEQERESAPEIDRGELRNLLRNSLVDGTMVWNRRLTEVFADDRQQYHLRFERGEQVIADLVIGGDGTWSKVRTLVNGLKPCYTGVTFIETG